MATRVEMTNPFEEVVPATASSSSSTLTKKDPYDVFINHRGSDVKHTLASAIYDALDRLGLRVFLDKEELELGDYIPDRLKDAMSSSFLHIAIFSPSYAQSAWCLAELSFMLKTGNRIIPVFYNVEPSDLRWATKGIYADALSKHQASGRYGSEKLEEWKTALQSISYHDGLIQKSKENEGMLLKSIVNHVLKYMKKVPLEVAKHPVGLDEAFHDFERSVLESSQGHSNVQIVGIVGMGGCGKTTLAKEIYNRKSSSMEKCSFLFNVRDAAAKNDLHTKQKILLEDLGLKKDLHTKYFSLKDPSSDKVEDLGLKDSSSDKVEDLGLKDSSFDNVEKGKVVLANRLRSLKLFIILDDVDHQDQLDALLPGIDNFAQGSVIIVTSREIGVLTSWGISSIYRIKELEFGNARKLLCWHAFLQPSPLESFEGLVEQFVDVCKGLPLSLKVFGGQLYGKPKNYWESQLNKISKLLPKDIKETLKISYDALDEEEQQIFLDIACFFNGEKKTMAIAVWDGCRWSGVCSWETLVNKCLVEVDEKNCIKMHDHLRDLGREIAIRNSPYRLWLPEQIGDIQKHTEDRLLIRGIQAQRNEFYEDLATKKGKSAVFDKYFRRAYKYFPRASSSHHQTPLQECMEVVRSSSFVSNPLQLLVIRGDIFTKDFATLSTGLVWLRCLGFRHKTLPSWISLKSLSVLEFRGAERLKRLWRDNVDPPLELRELIITEGNRFLSFPRSIGRLKKLKKIVLNTYDIPIRMRGLPEEFCLLQSLEHLELQACGRLRELPSNFGDLTNLRHLDLTFCLQLKTLPVSFKQLIHLEYINLSNCYKLAITSENILDDMTKLEILNFDGCVSLRVLPFQLTNQRSLRELDVSYTGLRELPNNFDQLDKLEVLKIGNSFFESLPISFQNMLFLTRLDIHGCGKLEFLPDSIGNLSSLIRFTISHCSGLESLPDSIGNLSSLITFTISHCSGLDSLPDSIGNLSSLITFTIFVCHGLESLPNSIGNLSSLTNLDITWCNKFESLPDSIGNLSSLTSLKIKWCSEFESLPDSIGNLSSLTSINISTSSDLKYSPDSISNVLSLTSFNISNRSNLKYFPDSIGNLSSLISLDISHCDELKYLPDSIGNLSSLISLDISHCDKLKYLPDSIGNLSSLTSLDISYCNKLKYLPNSIKDLNCSVKTNSLLRHLL